MGNREVRLNKEYAAWYPGLPAEEWIGAFTAQYLVGLQLKYGEPKWQAGERILNPEHFTFRGGSPSGPRTVERRRSLQDESSISQANGLRPATTKPG
jgi:hypothetical protein